MWKKFIHYLFSEPHQHSMTLFLALLCIEIFVFGPLSREAGSQIAIINGVVFSVLLIVGVLAMAPGPRTQVLTTFVVICAIALRWFYSLHHSLAVLLMDRICSLAASLVFLGLVLWQIYRESPYTVHKIRGASAAYLLFASIFAFLYNIIEILYPGAFTIAGTGRMLAPGQIESFQYFSIATITTVGFGDIIAVHPLARTLVMMEAIIGVLYPPILIGVLVSLHTEKLRQKS